ncbi:hypothetical protein P782_1546 [Enterococcus faecalis FL2]|nr:hypothetical protein EF62_1549 [Enterococcus faecalis 62]EJS81028.1 hypothetical protein A961_80 [Enterococcus faecalis ATCC 29212]KAJ62059.1 hypothetical protein P782_1546 [Enterococcus faecalis FL2]KAJ65801.1 hypothetical protein P787_1578 [Enterococcus faecalis MN16]KAJ73445.1 hypothetical protein M222_1810 [Enterococcus faecalis AZ19]KAJ79695.1 hypothetical protein P788_1179 [Enterococcus faecalis MTUP9]KAJ85981.1 hypothetical protein P790_0026 [Enterococcus faecalis NJ44]OSH07767.1 h
MAKNIIVIKRVFKISISPESIQVYTKAMIKVITISVT